MAGGVWIPRRATRPTRRSCGTRRPACAARAAIPGCWISWLTRPRSRPIWFFTSAICSRSSASRASKAADKLAKCGTRVIILQEGVDPNAREVFADIAERTGGALLPFDISSFDRIGKELVELIAVLAVEGVEAVEAKAATMPAATSLLLQNLDPKRLLIGHAKGG